MVQQNRAYIRDENNIRGETPAVSRFIDDHADLNGQLLEETHAAETRVRTAEEELEAIKRAREEEKRVLLASAQSGSASGERLT